MAIDDFGNKHDLFDLVTGIDKGRGWHRKYPGDFPDYELDPNSIDNLYLAVKKMKRCYHCQRNPMQAKYYGPVFDAIEEAYLSRDIIGFKTAMDDLLSRISAD